MFTKKPVKQMFLSHLVISVAEKSAILGSIQSPVAAEIAACNSELGDYLFGHYCQQCKIRLNGG